MKTQERGVYQRIRIYDAELWTQIERLKSTKRFRSFNDIVNNALILGLPLLVQRTFNFEEYYKEQKKINTDTLERNVIDIGKTVDEIYISGEIAKTLIATIYNILASNISGEPISKEMLEAGLLRELPEDLAKIEENFKRRMRKK